jgi:hypothetical protein
VILVREVFGVLKASGVSPLRSTILGDDYPYSLFDVETRRCQARPTA